ARRAATARASNSAMPASRRSTPHPDLPDTGQTAAITLECAALTSASGNCVPVFQSHSSLSRQPPAVPTETTVTTERLAMTVRTLGLTLLGLLLPLGAAASLIPKPPEVEASSYVLMDANSGQIIIEHNAFERLPPASLTKMMTAYIAEAEISSGNISMKDKVRISVKAWQMGGSRMFVREGTEVSMEDLLRGVVIQSGNDASVAIAEYIAGSEDAFADLMNQHAARMGLKDTHFVNSTGWPADNHYSSAHDMAILAHHIIRDYPQHYGMYAEKSFTYNNITQQNRNLMLWRDDRVDGLKTGHTEE